MHIQSLIGVARSQSMICYASNSRRMPNILSQDYYYNNECYLLSTGSRCAIDRWQSLNKVVGRENLTYSRQVPFSAIVRSFDTRRTVSDWIFAMDTVTTVLFDGQASGGGGGDRNFPNSHSLRYIKNGQVSKQCPGNSLPLPQQITQWLTIIHSTPAIVNS